MQWTKARERLATRAMLLALFLAVAAPDHWDLPTGWLPGHEHSHAATEESTGHAEHCHIDAASCSDAPVTSSSGVALLADWLALPITFERSRGIRGTHAHLTGHVAGVPTPPPRQAAASSTLLRPV